MKADGYPTYNFCHVIDDHLMNITHVVRGSEYLTSTPKYNLLYEAFGWEKPVYVHLPLIMGKNADGTVSKLSKRHGSTSFQGLLDDGYLAPVITNYIALLGWCPKDNTEIFSLAELENAFSIDGISKSPAVFDYDKLAWFNAEYIRAMDPAKFTEVAMPYFKEAIPEQEMDWALMAQILQPRVTNLKQIPEMISFFKELPEYDVALYTNKKSKTNTEKCLPTMEKAIAAFEALPEWNATAIHDLLMNMAVEMGVKNGFVMWPVRIAASGTAVTPGGAVEILAILGREESLKRLYKGLEKIKAALA
jgi:glutamyl-tRNA synthetase